MSEGIHTSHINIRAVTIFGRGTTVTTASMRKRPSVLSDLWCLTAVFASAKRMRKLTANAIGGQARRARQVADGQRLIREIMFLPPLAQTFTRNNQHPNVEARVRRVCGIYGEERMRNGINHTVSPCPPSEDLEDLERNRRNDSDVGAAERLSSLERRKRAVLNSSAEPIPCRRKAFMTD